MSAAAPAALMDRIYRHQRHIYDASRKFYLLGRDAAIAALQPPPGGSVLEIGCGTGRNLIRIAGLYPGRDCCGLDVSSAMLSTARRSVQRAGLAGTIRLAQADATGFEAHALFGRAAFDRIIISYALSMIPPWRAVVQEALRRLEPGGALHIVDFGDQAGLPRAFRIMLRRWLALFHVAPRNELEQELRRLSAEAGVTLRLRPIYRGYAVLAQLEKPRITSGSGPA